MRLAALVLLLGLAAPAAAAPPKRDICPSFAGLDTGPCTTEPGHVTAELLPIDFTHDHGSDQVEDDFLVGHFLVRAGVTSSTELQAEWVPYGHSRVRDRLTGQIERYGRAGDVTIGIRQNFVGPDGQGTGVAIQPFVTLPVGHRPVGAGDWGAGVIVPIAFDLSDAISLTFDPEADAAVDDDGDGRHLAYGGVVSLAAKLSEKLTAQLDYQGFRDRDPSGHSTFHRVAGTLTLQPGKTFALFSTAALGLDRDAPDLQLFVGVARLF